MDGDERGLIEAYVDGRLSESDVGKLRQLLRSSAEARAYLRSLASLDVGLHELAANPPQSEDRTRTGEVAADQAIPGGARTLSGASPLRRVLLFATSLAACLCLAVGWWFFGGEVDGKAIATLVQSSEAVWDGPQLSDGSELSATELALQSGIVRLRFEDGVEVTLQGPAKYQLIDVGRTRLKSGLLTASVPKGAEGFRVETPTAQIVDLGTSFGVRLDEQGRASVSVFDGQVEVVAKASDESRLLSEGDAVEISESLSDAEHDPAAYEKVWPVASGIAGSSGSFRVAPPWPRKLWFVRDDDRISVVAEGYPMTLSEPIQVNATEPGTYVSEESLTPAELPTGTRVQSYFLHFKPTVPDPSQETSLVKVEGAITFHGKILGVIGLEQELSATDSMFSDRNASIALAERELELRGGQVGDSFTIGEDRKTLLLKLSVPRIFSDRIRVIVDASVETTE